MKKITYFAEKLVNIGLILFNTYLIYKIFPNVFLSCVSIICHLILEKHILNYLSNGRYSNLLDEISQKILTGKDYDMTEFNDIVMHYKTCIIAVNLCISIALIFVYQISK